MQVVRGPRKGSKNSHLDLETVQQVRHAARNLVGLRWLNFLVISQPGIALLVPVAFRCLPPRPSWHRPPPWPLLSAVTATCLNPTLHPLGRILVWVVCSIAREATG